MKRDQDTREDGPAASTTGDGVEQAMDEALAGGDAPPADTAMAELEGLQKEMQALSDRHLRLAAEFDNYRKRTDRERAELHGRAQADLVRRLVDVLDDLDRVEHFNTETTSAAAMMEGVQLVEKKLRQVLESAGLEPVAAEGEYFDPASMEALAAVPTDRPEEDEAVADVFQKGYRFAGTLLRPARVRVKKYEG